MQQLFLEDHFSEWTTWKDFKIVLFSWTLCHWVEFSHKIRLPEPLAPGCLWHERRSITIILLNSELRPRLSTFHVYKHSGILREWNSIYLLWQSQPLWRGLESECLARSWPGLAARDQLEVKMLMSLDPGCRRKMYEDHWWVLIERTRRGTIFLSCRSPRLGSW